MILPALYHWAPSDRREAILKTGLQVFSEPVTHGSDHRFPYLCFGTTPSCAWAYSGGTISEIEEWDLWQVILSENDEMHVRPTFGNRLEEIRTYNSIPADRVWYVGTRVPMSAIEV